MKRLYILIVCMIFPSVLFAQDLQITSFYLAKTDLTANIPGTMMIDQNGNVCALIKMESVVDGFTFDVGVLGVCDVKRVGGEIWIYVPFGVRKITLSHPKLGVLREFIFPCPIEAGRTYIMQLDSDYIRTVIEPVVIAPQYDDQQPVEMQEVQPETEVVRAQVVSECPKTKAEPIVKAGVYGYFEGLYSYSTGVGLQARIGKITSRLHFVTGLRYQYTSSKDYISYIESGYVGDRYHVTHGNADYIQKNHQLVLPAILHINYYNSFADIFGFFGLGYEHGFLMKRIAEYTSCSDYFNEQDYLESTLYPRHTILSYPSRNAVLRMGMAAEHWDWSITMKLFLNMTKQSEGGSIGVDFTYYF